MRPTIMTLSVCILGMTAASAQGGKTLGSAMDVYVFPKEGQQSDQQSMDEASCYQWANDNTGNDPFDLQKQSAAQAEQTEKRRPLQSKQDRARVREARFAVLPQVR